MLRVSTIKLAVPAVPPLVTKLTLIVTFPAVVLVAVNLSMIALQFTAVYCVVCEFSACFGGISTLIDTVMSTPYVASPPLAMIVRPVDVACI